MALNAYQAIPVRAQASQEPTDNHEYHHNDHRDVSSDASIAHRSDVATDVALWGYDHDASAPINHPTLLLCSMFWTRLRSGIGGGCGRYGVLIVATVVLLYLSVPSLSRHLHQWDSTSRSDTHNTPNVAVLLSGAVRTMPNCFESFQRHVVAANPHMRFGPYFAHLTVDNDVNVTQAAEQVKSLLPARTPSHHIIVRRSGDVLDLVRQQLPQIDTVPPGQGTATGKAANIASMFYGIAEAERIRARAEPTCQNQMLDEMPVDCESRHDLVLRVRPDLCFCGDIKLSGVMSSDKAHVPWHSSNHDLVFDQFAFGVTSVMRRYGAALQGSGLEKEVRSNHGLYPEKVMGINLSNRGVEVDLLPGRFLASLARGPDKIGQVNLVDPFGKLKEDFDNGHLLMPAPHFQPYVC